MNLKMEKKIKLFSIKPVLSYHRDIKNVSETCESRRGKK